MASCSWAVFSAPIPLRKIHSVWCGSANGALDDSFQLPAAFSNNEPYIDGSAQNALPGRRAHPDGGTCLIPRTGAAPSMVLLEEDGSVADNLEDSPSSGSSLRCLIARTMAASSSAASSPIPACPVKWPCPGDLRTAVYRQYGRTDQTPVCRWMASRLASWGNHPGNLLTGADGGTISPELQPGSDYTVMPMLNTGHANGVKHFRPAIDQPALLGNNRFDSPIRSSPPMSIISDS